MPWDLIKGTTHKAGMEFATPLRGRGIFDPVGGGLPILVILAIWQFWQFGNFGNLAIWVTLYEFGPWWCCGSTDLYTLAKSI